ncbi:phage tail sheath C-terminal domain-containing protein [Acinetobacter sp. V91_7]|uniref:phage tail sheath C-terminal domain-containing protein n=1 Tax=unclassified Acinetobacter TaxID=196816 RepID=UPI00287EB103|nr:MULTISPECIES: phage tail sheath C-terminal domain-containing protein [unclassified Acinetobacter]MDS7933961.1 phage tail sheath C-terminal domain-containing protein [Acinetobacter sp. V91_4B]MDS7962703.1 phage tail sheath C-terminal domain-containing protein [Acinetobacter sp. V91_7]MDS8029394.1 phage tail sheath C-terminal domain-containing protein [Acinetobacter sp. V91_13]
MTLQNTLDTIKPLGHTIIAVSAPPAAGVDTTAWIDHLISVSDSIEQRPAILVVPFSDIEAAEAFADQAPVKTSYRVVAVCYHGATGQEPELAGAMAAALADSPDPALPFNGVNLGGITAVADEFKLTFERMEAAMNKGVCMIETGADGKPEIVRAISTFRINPDSGEPDDLMLDINCALIVDYTRKVVRQDYKKERRSKNTPARRRNLRTVVLKRLIQLDKAEILENVRESADQIMVNADEIDRRRVNVVIPTYMVPGLHVIATTFDIYLG